MKLTNKHNLPAPVVAAIQRHHHESGDYSASMLAQAPRQVWLKRRHEHEATEDAMDRVYALLGTAFHAIMEEHHGKDDLSEQFLTELVLGKKISGIADLYNGGEKCVRDYKTTSVWTIIFNSHFDDWTKQCNVYAWLYRKAGFVVDKLQVTAYLRDWMASRAATDPKYPQCMIITVDIPLWSEAEQLAYITQRVALFESHKETPDDALPFCTDEERWARDGKPPKRCGQYCVFVPWCNQRTRELENEVLTAGPFTVKAKAPKKARKVLA